MWDKLKQEEYDRWDNAGKEAATEILQTWHYYVTDGLTNERYCDGDIVAETLFGERTLVVEAEVKTVWKDTFTFDTYHIGQRKQHNTAQYFIGLNYDQTQAAIIKMRDVKDSQIEYKNTNGYRPTQNEGFFAVPLNKIKWLKKTDKGWKPV